MILSKSFLASKLPLKQELSETKGSGGAGEAEPAAAHSLEAEAARARRRG